MKKTKICAALTAAVCFSSVFASMPNFIVPSYAAEIVSNDFEVEYEGWHGTTPEFAIEAVNGGVIAKERIDDSLVRIYKVKFKGMTPEEINAMVTE